MNYKGVECPVCKKRFDEKDDIVVCPDCGTPHHRECYFSLSHCANEDRHSDGFVFEIPKLTQIENKILSGEAFDLPEQTSSKEEQTQGEFNNDDSSGSSVFTAPILGGVGQMGIDFGDNATVADIPINEAAAFVGNDANSKKLLFKLVMVDKFKSVRMNFITLLFPYLWFFYRKMYKAGILVIALMLTVTAVFTNANTLKYSLSAANLELKRMQGEITVEEYNAAVLDLAEKGTGNNEYYDMAPQVFNLAIRIVFALLANKLYLEHMKKQVMKTREECSSMDEYMAALTRKGGKSVGAAVAGVILYSAGVFVLYMILSSVYHIGL